MAPGVDPPLFAPLGACHSVLCLPVSMLVSQSLLNAGLTDCQIVRINSLSPILRCCTNCSRMLAEYGFRMLCPEHLVGMNIPIKSSDLTGFHRQFKPLLTLL